MEDVLAVYLRPRKADFPLICFDEAAKQLIANTHEPIKMKPGRPARTDYEYERNGTANLFISPVKMSRCDQAASAVTATISTAVSASDSTRITKAIVSAA